MNMNELKHRFIETNGIQMHLAEQGEGPVVLLCHGFPELWYSWRHQLEALAAAGFHAVAPDMRGYGQTDAPEAIDQPAKLTRDLDRRAVLLSGATAVAAIVAVAALLFVTTKPASRQSVATSIPSDITGSVPQTTQEDVASKPAPAGLKAPVTSPASQPDEQSKQLLERFLQWRERATNTPEASQ